MARPPEENLIYARQLGITKKRLIALGGAAKVKAMSEDARAMLLWPGPQPTRAEIHRPGGLLARGIHTQRNQHSPCQE